MGWTGKDRPVADSDYNGNGRVASAEIVRLFNPLYPFFLFAFALSDEERHTIW